MEKGHVSVKDRNCMALLNKNNLKMISFDTSRDEIIEINGVVV